jgi:acyl-coenzyme A synthetase/AMP-(fatty) acid ligase
MFLDLDLKNTSSIAAIDDKGGSISYGQLTAFSEEFFSVLKKRTLIFIFTDNCIGSLAGYVAALSSKIVPLLLSSTLDKSAVSNMISCYQPEYFWAPKKLASDFNFQVIFERYNYVLLKTGLRSLNMYDELSLLLTTSGSTGNPKLVRHSYLNIEENAKNVAEFFELKPSDRASLVLPMNFTMGLSVISSHLFAGSIVLLTKGTLTERGFWNFLREQRATSFTGVPYTYELLHRLHFFKMDLPELKLLTQGGGKLKDKLFKEYAEFTQKTGKKFVATYGQTEGTGRMAYLKADMAVNKTGSIGNAIPNGKLSLVDQYGEEIGENEAVGELIYRGKNVTLGYAFNGEDLAKGDENFGIIATGDIARRDEDGYYFIIGRTSRFLKLYGFRIGLDESEQMIKSAFDIDCTCSGTDDKMIITITDENMKEKILDYVARKTGICHAAFNVVVTDHIPRNEAGKSIYSSTNVGDMQVIAK